MGVKGHKTKMKMKIKNWFKKKKNQFMKSKFLVFTLGAIIGSTSVYIYITAPVVFEPITTKTIEINRYASAEVTSATMDRGVQAPLLEKTQTGKITPRELVSRYFGADNIKTALAIAKCESSLDPKRIGDKDKQFYRNGKLYGKSCGLFQIRLFPDRPSCDYLLDAENNVKYAKKIYDKRGWSAWSCYNNGNYLKYL